MMLMTHHQTIMQGGAISLTGSSDFNVGDQSDFLSFVKTKYKTLIYYNQSRPTIYVSCIFQKYRTYKYAKIN